MLGCDGLALPLRLLQVQALLGGNGLHDLADGHELVAEIFVREGVQRSGARDALDRARAQLLEEAVRAAELRRDLTPRSISIQLTAGAESAPELY